MHAMKTCTELGTMAWICMEEWKYGSTHS